MEEKPFKAKEYVGRMAGRGSQVEVSEWHLVGSTTVL